ncbi:hypothetical protein CK203_056989 [Vitis vinifera]|uniref:Uncharacterized protein n=1 Tax=Vitis vinifera TaxID=29760 RepID=A0A438GN06_VITVI|nr:hypothetical protein CK203_056989 [Vitis vinifera]
MRGGKSSFAVDSKSFEISVDVFGEKLKGIIVERSRGFTSWIRFGSLSLCCLLKGVEACYREAKKYCLVFPEGKGILGGWALLTEKLRSLGSKKIRESNVATVGGKRCAKQKGVVGPVSSWEMGRVSHVGSRLVRFGQLGKLWWEVQPRVSKVALVFKSGMGNEQKVRDDGGGGSCTDCNVEQDREVVTFDFVSARGAEDERVKGRVSSNWEEVSVEGAFSPRGLQDVDCRRPNGDDFGIQMGSPPPMPNHADYRRSFVGGGLQYTDYPPCSLFSLGKLDFSSSSTPSGQDGAIVTTDGGSERGCVSEAVGAQGAVEEVIEDVSERECQRRDSKGDFDIAERMKERKDQKGKLDGRKRKKLESSKFERELRKLECTVNYFGGGGEGKGRGGGQCFSVFAVQSEGLASFFIGLQCETLENLDAFALEVSFTEEKVLGVLLGCNGDKAPGLMASLWLSEKTYDNVDCLFFSVMQKMGFGEKWIGWIKWCISTASFSVLVNGTSTGFFQSSRGLRQGDPLSPYLFVIVMEVFSCFLKRAVDGASQDHLTYLSWLLMWFEAMLGLRINLEKSELIPVGRVENIDDLALDFGCRLGSLPSTYLGLPLGVPFKSVTVWDGVKERFRRRLASEETIHIQGREAFNDWEVEEAKRFLEWLHGKRVQGDVDDMVLWTETKSGNFLVKSLYLVLEEGCPSLFPSSYIWNVWVQPKISFLRGRLCGAKP